MNEELGSVRLSVSTPTRRDDVKSTEQIPIDQAIAQHESSLLRYAQHFVHDLDLARDIVQDTFLRLCRQNEPPEPARMSAWLFTVCRNRAIDVCRKERRMKVVAANQLIDRVDPMPGPNERLEKNEAVTGMWQQIGGLPTNQQEVLRLKFQGGLSYQEIADVTGLSRTNVGFLLHKAIAKLKSKLS